MVTTSMHFFPGAQILRSTDLFHWEHLGYVFDRLDDSPAQALDGGDIYGKGMAGQSTASYRQLLLRLRFGAPQSAPTGTQCLRQQRQQHGGYEI